MTKLEDNPNPHAAVPVLEEAKSHFETVGWWRGYEANKESRNVYAEGVTSVTATGACQCLATAVFHHPDALAYIGKALGVTTFEGIYRANDSQPATEKGRLWAIRTINRAIELATEDIEGEMA